MTEIKLASPTRQIGYIILAFAVTLPGVVIRFLDFHPPEVLAAVIFGTAVVGAAFLLSWAAEVVQLDIAAGLALALLALIAVLPEYAVDFVFTSKAGTEYLRTGQAGEYGPLALANMTGGNQLLIGLGWPLVVLLGTWRVRRAMVGPDGAEGATPTQVHLERPQNVEISFLVIASLYGLTLFVKESLTLFDAAVLTAIYVAYLIRLSKAPPHTPHLVGPSAWMGTLPRRWRRALNYSLFVVAAAVILLVAEPFAESVKELGTALGISEFVVVKWIAPTASEAPELLVAALFAWRLGSRTGLTALISSKVNQWTLLVGTLPIVFAIFSRSTHGLPLDIVQRDELLVTAAQSMFAVAILSSRSMNRREAWAMLTLFIAQLAESGLAEAGVISESSSASARVGVAVVFLLAGAWVIRHHLGDMRGILRDGFRTPWSELSGH